MADIVLRIFYVLSHLIFTASLKGGCSYDPQSMNGECGAYGFK